MLHVFASVVRVNSRSVCVLPGRLAGEIVNGQLLLDGSLQRNQVGDHAVEVVRLIGMLGLHEFRVIQTRGPFADRLSLREHLTDLLLGAFCVQVPVQGLLPHDRACDALSGADDVFADPVEFFDDLVDFIRSFNHLFSSFPVVDCPVVQGPDTVAELSRLCLVHSFLHIEHLSVNHIQIVKHLRLREQRPDRAAEIRLVVV